MLVPSVEHESRVKEAAALLSHWRGRNVQEVPTPAAVVDRGIVSAHCEALLAACRELDMDFRAHIKTHKTVEGTRLQVGDASIIRLVVSTIPEIAIVLPWLLEEAEKWRSSRILYSMPLHPSAVAQLDAIAQAIPARKRIKIEVMIDHPDQIKLLDNLSQRFDVFLKLDTGLHRAGVPPDSDAFSSLVAATIEGIKRGSCLLTGVYSHASQSYAVTDPERAMDILADELRGCQVANAEFQKQLQAKVPEMINIPLTFSVGATPTATAARNLVANVTASTSESAQKIRALLKEIQADTCLKVELHAGVYPFLDLQQISTQAAPSATHHGEEAKGEALNCTDVAFTVLTEVASVYPHRDPPQALVTAGSLALGREPCPRYTGFGAIQAKSAHKESGWGGAGRSGWVVGKISQEHGLLFPEEATGWEGTSAWTSGTQLDIPYTIGQRLRIIPNHACIAGAGFPWYYVVDGSDEIVDIWVRCQGWHCISTAEKLD